MTEQKTYPRFATFLLALSMFTTGACGLVSEYILSTVSTYILGNSIEQFSIVIALMMLMMGVAGVAQKYFNDENLLLKFFIVEAILALVAGFAPLGLYAAFGYMEYFELAQYALICIIGFLIGFEIPLVLRINKKYSKSLGTNLASIYAADYIGAFVGAMVWTFYLLRTFPLTHISFILAILNFFIACITILYFQVQKIEGINKNYIPGILMIILTPILFLGLSQNQDWSKLIEQRLYDDKIVFTETTKYQHLVMTNNPRVDEYRFFINGNLQWASSDEVIYHELLVHPIMNMVPDHERVLILGGGDGMALREALKYPDVKEILLVDLDPEMTEFSAKNEILSKINNNAFASAKVKSMSSGAISSEGSKPVFVNTGKFDKKNRPIVESVADIGIINIDADKFVDEVKGKWNVIIVDLPDPNSIELAKMYSKEFFMKVRRVLSETGMVVIQSTSPYHAKEAYLCIMRTMQAAGFEVTPYHHNVPSFGDWGWILAQKPSNNFIMDERLKSIDALSVETKYITPDVFKQSLVFGKGLLTTNRTSVSTLMEPAILQLYLHHSWLLE